MPFETTFHSANTTVPQHCIQIASLTKPACSFGHWRPVKASPAGVEGGERGRNLAKWLPGSSFFHQYWVFQGNTNFKMSKLNSSSCHISGPNHSISFNICTTRTGCTSWGLYNYCITPHPIILFLQGGSGTHSWLPAAPPGHLPSPHAYTHTTPIFLKKCLLYAPPCSRIYSNS